MKLDKKESLKKKLYGSRDYMGKIKTYNDSSSKLNKQNNYYSEKNFCSTNNQPISLQNHLNSKNKYKITYSSTILKNEKQTYEKNLLLKNYLTFLNLNF